MHQSNGFVHGHSAAALLGLAVAFVPRVHVLLREIAAEEVKMGGVQRDQFRVHHVVHLQRKQMMNR